MLDKLTSVSPPQTDSLMKNQRSEKQKDLGAKDFKRDFKDNLKEQIKIAEKKETPKDVNAKKTEGQPGEHKKKVAKKESEECEDFDKLDDQLKVKVDPTMISMNMVSIENEVEVPDESENLAMIEESKINLTPDLTSDRSKNLAAPTIAPQPAIVSEPQKMPEASSIDLIQATEGPEESKKSESSEAIDVSTADVPTAFQEKIMDVLKKDQFEQPQIKLEQMKEKLVLMKPEFHPESQVESSTALVANDDVKDDTKNAGQRSNSDSNENSKENQQSNSKSLKEDFIKSELTTTDSKHTGQSEFHSQLLAPSAEHSKGAQALTKPDSAAESGIQQLLNQANYLVTKGGGEVTLKMNSVDGIGEVHLKVTLSNGQMNIELNTQDKSVKKLIEDSLSDLRSSLAAKQISLEHVKINSVNAINTENSAQSLQSQSNSSGSESNQSKTFAELQQQDSHRQNQKQQSRFSNSLLNEDRPVVLPMKNVQKSAASQYYGLNKARTLNAVA